MSTSSSTLHSPRSNASSTLAPSTFSTGSSAATGSQSTNSNENLSPVVWKLALFTLLMIIGPIGTYFLTLNYYFHDPTPSAISAAFVANLVLVGFVIVAFLEDQNPDLPPTQSQSQSRLDEFTKEKIRAGKKE